MKRRTDKRYSKVSLEVWGDDRFAALSPLPPSGQSLWLYLLLCPFRSLIPGLLLNIGLGTISDRLGWSLKAVQKHWKELPPEMAQADWKAGVIWLPNAIVHNRPESPNVVTSWRTVVLPVCPLVSVALMGIHQSLMEGFDDAFVKAFVKAFSKDLPEGEPMASGKGVRRPSGNQEHEQEHEQEISPTTRSVLLAPQPMPIGTSSASSGLLINSLQFDRLKRANAFVGQRLRVPHVLHEECRNKLGGENPDCALREWYAGVDDEIVSTKEPVPDVFAFLRPRFKAWADEMAFQADVERFRPKGA